MKVMLLLSYVTGRKTRDTIKTAFLLLRWMVTTESMATAQMNINWVCILFISHSSLIIWSSTWTWTQLAALLLAPLHSFLLFLTLVPAPSQLPTPKLHHILYMSMSHKAPYYNISLVEHNIQNMHVQLVGIIVLYCLEQSIHKLLYTQMECLFYLKNTPFDVVFTTMLSCCWVATTLPNSLALQESAKYMLKLYQPHAW